MPFLAPSAPKIVALPPLGRIRPRSIRIVNENPSVVSPGVPERLLTPADPSLVRHYAANDSAGDKRGWDLPGFWFRLTPSRVMLGTGMHMLGKDQLERFRQSVIHPRSGRALLAAIAEVRTTGEYDIGEKTRKLPPRGYQTDADRAEYLLYEGLTAGTELPASAAAQPDFADRCLEHFANTWPIARWLIAEVAD